MLAKEEVVTKAAVEVLDEGTGAGDGGEGFEDSGADGMEARTELAVKEGLASPVGGVVGIVVLELAERLDGMRGDLEFGCDGVEFILKQNGESEQRVTLVLQFAAERSNTVRAKGFAGAQFADDEVVEFAAGGQRRTGSGEDVVAEPIAQDAHVAVDGESLGRLVTSEQDRPGEGIATGADASAEHFVFQGFELGGGGLGAALEVEAEFSEFAFGMEDIAMAGDGRPGLGLTGA